MCIFYNPRVTCAFHPKQTQRLSNHFRPGKLFKLTKHYGLDGEPIPPDEVRP